MKDKRNVLLFALGCMLCSALLATFIWAVDQSIRNQEEQISGVREEQAHLYYKTIECTILDCDYRHWYASAHHYTADVTVYNKKYDLTETFHLTNDDARRCEKYKIGDTISAELYSWVIPSTDYVKERRIGSISP